LDGAKLQLDEHEAHYLAHVLRLARGEEVIAFNGRGTERRATVGSLQRRGGELELDEPLQPRPESQLDLTLVQALPKSDAMDLIVQKATELGARAIRPVFSEFSVVKLDDERGARRVEHWRRIAQSACEQCGRHTPPEIAAPEPLPACLESLPAASRRIALDPAAELRLADLAPAPNAVVLLVGSEGGLGANDWRRLDSAHFERARLGPRVLRAETAAVAACALAQALWGDS
jgi:16S rRNA (uracil1498-N3)-methyltransferase